MPALLDFARRAAKRIPMKSKKLGPWLGSDRSHAPDQVPPEYLNSGTSTRPAQDYLYVPRTGFWKRRQGTSIKFDTLSGSSEVTGLLPAAWSGDARARYIEEFLSDSVTDGIPTLIALITKETLATSTNLDDGFFSQVWWRDQVLSANRTFCDDYNAATYPIPGSIQYYRVAALWHDSGDGGLSRGVNEFSRRLMANGSRRFKKVNNEWYAPNLKGTPWRDNGIRAGSASINSTMASDINSGGHGAGDVSGITTSGTVTGWSAYAGAAGATNLAQPVYQWVTSIDDDTSYIANSTASGAGNPQAFNLSSSAPTGLGTWTVTYRHRWLSDPGGTKNIHFRLVLSDGKYYDSGNINVGGSGTSWLTATATIDTSSGGVTAGTPSSLEVIGPNVANYWCVTYLALSNGTNTSVHRLMPTGPIPPTHSGTIAGSSAITPVYGYPDADTTTNSWVPSSGPSLYLMIDETTDAANDADWIGTTAGTNTMCEISLSDPGVSPTSAAGDTVTLRYRVFENVASGTNSLTVALFQGATQRATNGGITFTHSQNWTDYSIALTDAEIDAITVWTNLGVRITNGGHSGSDAAYVSRVRLEVLSGAASSDGGWKGKDRFYKAAAYREKVSGAIWHPTIPRAPNSILSNGFDLVTVDVNNPELAYTKIVWSNLPVPPPGFDLVLMRTDKIDSTVDDNLQLNPLDLKVVATVPGGTTTYDDFFGDDGALLLDPEHLFVRFDGTMPPPARYNEAADMRMFHLYGRPQNPCAIEIAFVGAAADYDRNAAEDSSTIYASQAGYFRIALDSSNAMTMTLNKSDGTTLTTTTYTITTTPTSGIYTIQQLVDTINNTAFANDSQQWRAQLCPGALPETPATYLLPHTRDIDSCVVSGQTITKAAGGLGKIAVGSWVDGTGVTNGAYISQINSDTSLTFVGTITAATKTLTFFQELGDQPRFTSGTAVYGYQRAFANSRPEFIYFNKTFQALTPVEKSSVWMTVATPGSVKSAPNCFSAKLGNKHATPDQSPGIGQGLVPVDNGVVVFYANKIGAIRPRGPDSIRDEDYGLHLIDHSQGCCAWNTVATGNRFGVCLTPFGVLVADLQNTMLLSERIWLHPDSDATVGVGDFSYEIPKSVAATAMDIDIGGYSTDTTVGQYASAKVMRSAIWVAFRTSASTTHPNRQVVYDFSSDEQLTGLAALKRPNGTLYGWSLPLTRSVTAMAEGRRSDGLHLYGWKDTNAGTGDGRIDEMETGNTDNGTEIAAYAPTWWIKEDGGRQISGQHAMLEHKSPAGSTGSLVWHRTNMTTGSDDTYTMTPTTGAAETVGERKDLPVTGARVQTNAGFWDYAQATGSPRTLKSLIVYWKDVLSFK